MPEYPTRDTAWWTRFKALLDDQTTWPAPFLFKFIVPAARVPELQALFPDYPTTTRASSKGTYVSVSLEPVLASSDEVVAIYEAAGQVEGIVML